MNKVCIILSGGMDSTLLTHVIHNENPNIVALSFFYGQKQNIELEKAKETCNLLNIEHKIIDISFMSDIVGSKTSNVVGSKIDVPDGSKEEDKEITYIPFRNLLFLTLAASFCEANNIDTLYTGFQTGNSLGYWDTTESFVFNLNKLLRGGERNLTVVAPFVEFTKEEEIAYAVSAGVNINEALKHTISCYNPTKEGESCKNCSACSKRLKVLSNMSIVDPIKYIKE